MSKLSRKRLTDIAYVLALSVAFYFYNFSEGIAKSIASIFFTAVFVIWIVGIAWDGFNYARYPNYQPKFGLASFLFWSALIAFAVVWLVLTGMLVVILTRIFSAAGIAVPEILFIILLPIPLIGGMVLGAVFATWLFKRLDAAFGKQPRQSAIGF